VVDLDKLTFAGKPETLASLQGNLRHLFVQTNIVDTFKLIESVRCCWSCLAKADKASFRFLHVSTVEVYGSLAREAPAFAETNTRIAPESRQRSPGACLAPKLRPAGAHNQLLEQLWAFPLP
jgi:GDP-mannose 4,6 dehydratase